MIGLRHLAWTKLHRLSENVGAAAVELTQAELSDIEAAMATVAVQGAPNICRNWSAAEPDAAIHEPDR